MIDLRQSGTYISRHHAKENVSIKGKIALVGPGPQAEYGLGITGDPDQRRLSGDQEISHPTKG